MADTLVVPVPEKVLASFVIAAPRRLPSGLLPGALTQRDLIDLEPRVVLVGSDVEPMPELLEHLGCADCGPHCPPELLDRLREADGFIVVLSMYGCGWPPLHVWTAASTAQALAIATGGILIDPSILEVRPAGWEPLPLQAPWDFAVADWVKVICSSEPEGIWASTSGLARFGLPELQVKEVPEALARPWCDVLHGLALVLLCGQWAALGERPELAFREFPGAVTVTSAAVESALGFEPSSGGGSAELVLQYDPGPPGEDSFLTVLTEGSHQAVIDALV